MFIIMFPITLLDPPKNPPRAPWAPYVIPAVGALMLIAGVYWFKKTPPAMRLMPGEIELPRFDVSIPWSEIAEIDVVHVPQQRPPGILPLLVMVLTPAGRKLIGNRRLTNSPHASKMDPQPDVCLKANFWSYGPGIDTSAEFAADLRNRMAAASGAVDEMSPLPPLDAPLELRDMSETGPSSRVYAHELCGGTTVVSGGSLYWATNPLRYTGGAARCAQCGKTFDLSVRWIDTGETLSRFRTRMWRRTPLIVKVLQFLIVPALIGVVATVLAPAWAPRAANIPPLADKAMSFAVGFVVGNLVIWLTPLAGVIPTLAGLSYHKYR